MAANVDVDRAQDPTTRFRRSNTARRGGRAVVLRRWASVAAGIVLVLALSTPPAEAEFSNAPDLTVTTDGPIDAMVRLGDRIYLGGSFDRVGGTQTPFGAGFSTGSGKAKTGFATPNGDVRAAVSDGVGGFYIAGDFTAVGGVPRTRIAHITAAGAVDAFFNPDVNGRVNALAVSSNGHTVYAGGDFTRVNGDTTRNHLAQFDRNGKVTAFDPDVNGTVRALAVRTLSGNRDALFAGGDFSRVNATKAVRHDLAGFYPAMATNNVLRFDPNVDGSVKALALSGATLYAGGTFATVNGDTHRDNLAGFDTSKDSTKDVTPFDVGGAHLTVLSLAASGTTLYVARHDDGSPYLLGGELAAFDTTKSTKDKRLGAYHGHINALTLSGSTLYAGGSFFLSPDSAARPIVVRDNLAVFDTATGKATDFVSYIGGPVYALARSGDTLYTGGTFNFVGGEERSNLAAVDAKTGAVTPFNSRHTTFRGYVRALVASEHTVYAGGVFDDVGAGLVALDATTGARTAFRPNVRGCYRGDVQGVCGAGSPVGALALSGNTLYVGGLFGGKLNGQEYSNTLATIDVTTGNGTAFNPVPGEHESDVPSALVLSDDRKTLYVGGDFHQVGKTTGGGDGFSPVNSFAPRERLAAFDTATRTPTAFNPNVTLGGVSALLLSGNTLYAGGAFGLVNGSTTRNRLAAFDTSTGVATAFNPNITGGGVAALLLAGGTLYAGGDFSGTVNGDKIRNHLAAFDTATGTATAFDPNLNGAVHALESPSPQTLYAGGEFTAAGGPISTVNFARFTDGPTARTALSQ